MMKPSASRLGHFRNLSLWRAAAVLSLSLLVLAGMAVPARAVVSSSGPEELLLDPVTGRLYTYLADSNHVLVMDVASGQLIHTVRDVGIPANRNEGTGIRALALDGQAGRLFALNSAARGPGGQDWTLFAIDAAQGTIVQQASLGVSLSLPYDQLHADSATGKLYAVGEETTAVYDIATLTEQGTLPGGSASLLDGLGGRLYLVGDDVLVVISTSDDTVMAELGLPEEPPDKMAVDPSRGRLYLTVEGAIHVLDTAAWQWLDPLANVPPSIQTLAADPADGELYVVGPEEGDDPMAFRVSVLSPETGERKAAMVFQEPTPPEGTSCGGYLWTIVRRLVPDPAGGRIYGTGNAMSRCTPEAHLAFVLDTEAEAVVEWLPRLQVLPMTGGPGMGGDWLALPGTGERSVGGDWLVLAGAGLLLLGMFMQRQRDNPAA